MNGTTYAAGAFFGARLADKWGKRDVRAYGWLPAISIGLALPVALITWWVPSIEASSFCNFISVVDWYLSWA